jgi:hypothetical protein
MRIDKFNTIGRYLCRETSQAFNLGWQHAVELLEGWFQRTAPGARPLVFGRGEVGLGKMTVLGLCRSR